MGDLKEQQYYNRVSRFDKLIILCFLVGSFLYSYSFYDVNLSELFYILDLGLILLYIVILREKVSINILDGISFLFLLFLIWMFINTLIQVNYNVNFNIEEMSKTLFHLLFYIVLYLLVKAYLSSFDRCKFNYFNEIFFNILFVVSIISLYIYIGILTKGLLPYDFFWTGIKAPFDNYLLYGIVPRSRGIFSEPAALGYYLNMGLAYILFRTNYSYFKHYEFKLTIVVINILMTLSLSSYLLLLSILVLNLRFDYKFTKNKIQKGILILLLVIVFLYFFIVIYNLQCLTE
ncbi:hypothetical protein O163_03725 [Caldanaerobacter subterraneus subsp. yonseiensis KB-1]|uniref:Uncharacterized protein n=1 Tax=Caldanaerobacter subterraneus subsp. yonseiensis KB-1 TaxID=1388761 RepID=U5CRW8_CALSX|nr:hypothetical protein [Caldanaerobacter subterraneus]ERM92718.1 hypothetical protein O163_03725 [Caldanaerobacter subterraneus subsp. yonseiensis KB-1]